METEYCPRCKEYKSIAEFNKNRSSNSGLADYCRECDKKRKNHDKYRTVVIKGAMADIKDGATVMLDGFGRAGLPFLFNLRTK